VSRAINQIPAGGVYTFFPRLLSLMIATGLAGYIFVFPKSVLQVSHSKLTLIMFGICIGFVHGVGFIPETKLWRNVLSPWIAWSLMTFGLWLLLKNQVYFT
jgi:predicted membrane protein